MVGMERRTPYIKIWQAAHNLLFGLDFIPSCPEESELYFLEQLKILISAHPDYTHVVFDNECRHFFVFRYDHRPDSSGIIINNMIAFCPSIHASGHFKNLDLDLIMSRLNFH